MMLVTHRGPFRFLARDDGGFDVHRGAGGVVSAFLPLIERGESADGERVAWIAAAIDEDDTAALAADPTIVSNIDLHLLGLDPEMHRRHYDVVSNATLWLLHHGLYDLPRRPRFDEHFREAWNAYASVNAEFARAVVERAKDGETVQVHDYQLALVPGMVRAARPDVRMMHFTHTPFCGPSSIRVLPTDVAIELCRSMATVPAGFHTQRWADAYAASVRTMLGLEAPAAGAFAAPLGPDADLLAESAAMPETRQFVMELDELVGDRALVVRVDRIDLSKNIVRGFLAYDRFLARYPEWRERVVFVAMLNRSRDTLAEYLAYQQEVEQAVARVNGRWSRPGWDPIVLDTRDSYTRSLAGFARYDVLFVNPVKDGLNLVAKEGPLVNERSGVLCLSPEAGAYEELAEAAVPVHPYDLEQDASALHEALTMTAAERARRADRLRELVGRHTPRSWLNTLTRHAR
jgi:trehalose 6-phosphate synthase